MAMAKPKDLKSSLRNFAPYFKHHAGALLCVVIFAALSAFCNVYGTYLFNPIIDNYIIPGNMDGLFQSLLFLGIIYGIGVVSTLIYTQLMVRVSQQIIYELRQNLFIKIQTLPMPYLDSKTHGELMSRFTNDIDVMTECLNNSFATIIQSFVTLVCTIFFMLIISWNLSIVVLLSFALMFLFLRWASARSRQYFSAQQEYMSDLNGFIEERIDGQKVVQVFNHEPEDLDEFRRRNDALRKAGTTAQTYGGMLVPVVVSISYLNYALSSFIGAFIFIGGGITLGALSAYLVFVRQLAMPINQFAQQINILLAGLSGLEHIYEVMDQSSEIDNGTITRVPAYLMGDGSAQEAPNITGEWAWKVPQENGEFSLIPLRGNVEFHQVYFSYIPGHLILSNINLFAKPGQKIAFVGSTGAGKTTITNLVNRFYEVDIGTITYDGLDICDIKKKDLRLSLSMVLQDTHLFTGTIAENIRYSAPQANMEQIKEAARMSNADAFIRRLPKGYDTMLTSDGSNLSQGQRQLLSIARAAVADPPVLILDEATSSVDTYTEKLIDKGMDHLMNGRTVFVIAHRLSTVRNSNAIMVLEHGEIVERGDHGQLVAQQGRYYQLYTGQFELS